MATRPDSSNLLSSIAAPTTVLAGGHDALTPPVEMRAMARNIPGAIFTEIPRVGHLSNLEAPKLFDTAPMDLINRL